MNDFCGAVFAIIVISGIIYYFYKYYFENSKPEKRKNTSRKRWSNRSERNNTSTQTSTNQTPLNRPTHPISRTTLQSHTTTKIKYPQTANHPFIPFNDLAPTQPHFLPKIEDLHDALTGEQLDINRGLFQCNTCKVFYHADSYAFLKEMNHSACVSCQKTDIIQATLSSPTKISSKYKPSVITLENYREFVGRVVTFEGFVHNIRESNRGNDFAVMFENSSWKYGFKLVFFRGSLSNIGGREFVCELLHKTIRVRGLIIKHDVFGYEIIVTNRHMIMDIK